MIRKMFLLVLVVFNMSAFCEWGKITQVIYNISEKRIYVELDNAGASRIWAISQANHTAEEFKQMHAQLLAAANNGNLTLLMPNGGNYVEPLVITIKY